MLLVPTVHAQPGSFLNPYAPQFNALDFSVDGSADYLFADDAHKGRTWGEKVFYATGGSYLIGLCLSALAFERLAQLFV